MDEPFSQMQIAEMVEIRKKFQCLVGLGKLMTDIVTDNQKLLAEEVNESINQAEIE